MGELQFALSTIKALSQYDILVASEVIVLNLVVMEILNSEF